MNEIEGLMGNYQRKKYFVDSPVQGAILLHAAGYWLYASITYTLVVLIYRVAPTWLAGRSIDLNELWYHFAPLFISSVVLFPIVMFRAVRFSHRFVGPMVRFRQILRLLAEGKPAPQFTLREDDFWIEVAEELNQVSAMVEKGRLVEGDEVTSDDETKSDEKLVEVGSSTVPQLAAGTAITE
jgi:hypothetical protein